MGAGSKTVVLSMGAGSKMVRQVLSTGFEGFLRTVTAVNLWAKGGPRLAQRFSAYGYSRKLRRAAFWVRLQWKARHRESQAMRGINLLGSCKGFLRTVTAENLTTESKTQGVAGDTGINLLGSCKGFLCTVTAENLRKGAFRVRLQQKAR
jgi:hypothetical protein